MSCFKDPVILENACSQGHKCIIFAEPILLTLVPICLSTDKGQVLDKIKCEVKCVIDMRQRRVQII